MRKSKNKPCSEKLLIALASHAGAPGVVKCMSFAFSFSTHLERVTSEVRVGEWRGQDWSSGDVIGRPGLLGEAEGQWSLELSEGHIAVVGAGMPGSSEF